MLFDRKVSGIYRPQDILQLPGGEFCISQFVTSLMSEAVNELPGGLAISSSDIWPPARRISASGSASGELNAPSGLACYESSIYVCDRNNHRIQKLRIPDGAFEAAYSGEVKLKYPQLLAVSNAGEVVTPKPQLTFRARNSARAFIVLDADLALLRQIDVKMPDDSCKVCGLMFHEGNAVALFVQKIHCDAVDMERQSRRKKAWIVTFSLMGSVLRCVELQASSIAFSKPAMAIARGRLLVIDLVNVSNGSVTDDYDPGSGFPIVHARVYTMGGLLLHCLTHSLGTRGIDFGSNRAIRVIDNFVYVPIDAGKSGYDGIAVFRLQGCDQLI